IKETTPPNHPVAVSLALKVRGRAGAAPYLEAGQGDRPAGAGSTCARLVADVDPIIPGPGEAGVAVIGRRGVAAVGIVVIPPAPYAQAEACADRPPPATPAPAPAQAATAESGDANAA